MRANYRNYARSIEPELEHWEKFFRNLLLGETNELKNCYLIISTPEELTPQCDPQVPYKYPASCFRQIPPAKNLFWQSVTILAPLRL